MRSGRKNNRGEAAVLEIEGAGQEVYMKLPWRKPSQLRRPEGLVQTYRWWVHNQRKNMMMFSQRKCINPSWKIMEGWKEEGGLEKRTRQSSTQSINCVSCKFRLFQDHAVKKRRRCSLKTTTTQKWSPYSLLLFIACSELLSQISIGQINCISTTTTI